MEMGNWSLLLFLPSKGIIEGRFSLRENQLQNLGTII